MRQTATVVAAANYDVPLILSLGMINITRKSPTDTISERLNVIRVQRYFAATSFFLIAVCAYVRSLRGVFDLVTANIVLSVIQIMIELLHGYFFNNCFERPSFCTVVRFTYRLNVGIFM